MNYLNLLERKNYQSFVIKATEDEVQNGKNLLKKLFRNFYSWFGRK